MAKGLCLVKAEGGKKIKARMDGRDGIKEVGHWKSLESTGPLHIFLICTRPLFYIYMPQMSLPILELQDLKSTKDH